MVDAARLRALHKLRNVFVSETFSAPECRAILELLAERDALAALLRECRDDMAVASSGGYAMPESWISRIDAALAGKEPT
jgi:hypothetical protein